MKDQTENNSLGAPADGQEEERLEIPLLVWPDMTEEIPLERAQFLGEEGKVVRKRECPTLKSPPAGTGLERPGKPHLKKMQQTVVDRFSHACCTRSTDQEGKSLFK